MVNVRLVVEYNGARFHGWQMQPGQRTIEGELERVLSTILREPIHPIYASGRTDAGVHARGQVVNFHMSSTPDLLRIGHSISNILRGELTVLKADIVPDDFHSRHSAVCKQYSYTILNRLGPAVLDRGRVWYIGTPLDVEMMNREAGSFIGRHDFKSFQGAGCAAKTSIKVIHECEVVREGYYVIFRVVGEGFLKHMVRIMVGTLVSLSRKRIERSSIADILAACDRGAAGVTAPSHGLCLDWVRYDR